MLLSALQTALTHVTQRFGLGKKAYLSCDDRLTAVLARRHRAFPVRGAIPEQGHIPDRFDWLLSAEVMNEPQNHRRAAEALLRWCGMARDHGDNPKGGTALGARVVAWLGAEGWLKNIVTAEESKLFYQALSQQIALLKHYPLSTLNAFDQFECYLAQGVASLCCQDYEERQQDTLLDIENCLSEQILPDGGHVSRNPLTLLRILNDCLMMRDMIMARQQEVPTGILRAIDRMVPMIRSLRLGDGGLACFQGSYAHSAEFIDHLLEESQNQGRAFGEARYSHYQRIEAQQTIVIMDSGIPPSEHSHKAPLALEMSYGSDRLLVNCGHVLEGSAQWQDALAETAAHSTLVVDDTSCPLPVAGKAGPDWEVTCRRMAENGEVLLEAHHDGYKADHGLRHHRSVYVNKMGEDIRVEDTLRGAGGDHFTIHIHLHPTVQVSLVPDGNAALLKTASGVGWHLRVQGASLDCKESIYAGDHGRPKPTEQIVLSGPLRGEGANVKWRLAKLGGL